MRAYSLAEARDNLTAIVRDVEKTSPVELTRRGKPVAVILSIDEYHRLTQPAGSFSSALERFREHTDVADMALGPEIFEGIRDADPGREPVL
jgi:prevent-host-death family protein